MDCLIWLMILSYGTIRSKVSRKQLCCNRKGLIDTEHPLNFIYLVEVNGGDQSVFDKYALNGTNVSKKSSVQTKRQENVLNIKQSVFDKIENSIKIKNGAQSKKNKMFYICYIKIKCFIFVA